MTEAPDPIYLDHNATTPVADEVREAMLPWLGARFGNPSSGHAYGRAAAVAVARARAQVAELIGAQPPQIVFTSGGTEADNLAVRRSTCARERVVTSAVEHPAVEEPARALQSQGWRWDQLAVGRDGAVDLEAARSILAEPCGLLSVILAQNETGVVQPVAALTELARAAAADVVVHTDAAQAVGKIDVDVDGLGVDLLTIVGHKLYGPCGIGALYVRTPGLVRPWALGGGQERGVRPGTEPTPSIVGLGEACRIAGRDLEAQSARQRALCQRLQARLRDRVPKLHVTGADSVTLPNTLHVCFPDCTGADLLAGARAIAASTGSACHSDGGGGGVLGAMGLDPAHVRGAVRLSIGRRTREEDIADAAEALVAAWARVRTR